MKCWECQFCDKEYFLKNNNWVLTRTGYCLAEFSKVNGKTLFYQKVYVDNVVDCDKFKNKLT